MPSPDPLAAVEAALTRQFGQPPSRASVSFVGVEPIEVLRYRMARARRVYVSLGMARHPMVGPDVSIVPADGPRAELLLAIDDPADRFGDVWRSLAVLAAAPAVEGVVYTPGMSVDLGEPLAAGATCTGVLVSDEVAPSPVTTPLGLVRILAVVPATPTELAWCRVRGAEALTERWMAAGTSPRDLARAPVALD